MDSPATQEAGRWEVRRAGQAGSLVLRHDGLEVNFPTSSTQLAWDEVAAVEFPTPYSVRVAPTDGTVHEVGFAGTAQQREFRDALHAVRRIDANAPRVPSVVTAARWRGVQVTTLHTIPGREVLEVLGLVTGHQVMSRNAVSDLGSDMKSVFGGALGGVERAIASAMEEATNRLQQAAASRGADAVLAVSVTLESVSDKAQAVLIYGTAVTLMAHQVTVSAPPEAPGRRDGAV